jgi:hypothetical protein
MDSSLKKLEEPKQFVRLNRPGGKWREIVIWGSSGLGRAKKIFGSYLMPEKNIPRASDSPLRGG